MPEISEWMAFKEKVAAERAKHVHEQRTAVAPRIKEIAFKAQTVVDHPGWQFYLDTLETRIREVQGRRVSTAERMVTGQEMGHELELLKINLNTMDAEIAALKYAQELIPQAIEQGQRIVTGVGSQAAAGSADR